MSVTFTSKDEMRMYAARLFDGKEAIVEPIMERAKKILEKKIPEADDKFLTEWGYKGKAVPDPAQADERIEKLSRILYNRINGFISDSRYSLARQVAGISYIDSSRDSYERDSWYASYDEDELLRIATRVANEYCTDEAIERLAMDVCEKNSPALVSLETLKQRDAQNAPSKNAAMFKTDIPEKPAQDNAAMFKTDIPDKPAQDNAAMFMENFVEKPDTHRSAFAPEGKSFLDSRTEGKGYVYSGSQDAKGIAKADAWIEERNPQKLLNAVLFSNGQINNGQGFRALSNIARNPDLPAEGLFMIARGELDNQGEKMLSNSDVVRLWDDVLENPKCPPELAMEIAMNAAVTKSVDYASAFIWKTEKALERMDSDEVRKKFPEYDDIMENFHKLDHHMISKDEMALSIENVLIDHGYLDMKMPVEEKNAPDNDRNLGNEQLQSLPDFVIE